MTLDEMTPKQGLSLVAGCVAIFVLSCGALGMAGSAEPSGFWGGVIIATFFVLIICAATSFFFTLFLVVFTIRNAFDGWNSEAKELTNEPD